MIMTNEKGSRIRRLRRNEFRFKELLVATTLQVYLFPASCLSSKVDNVPLQLEAYRSANAAKEAQFRSNDLQSFYMKNCWRNLKPDAVPFSTKRSEEPLVFAGNAPLEFWAVADLDNGEPFKAGGRIWMFAFDTKAEAEKYQKNHRVKREGVLGNSFSLVELSQPFKLYQVGYTKKTKPWQVDLSK